MNAEKNEDASERPLDGLVGRFPTRDELRRQFQARLWREYAMAWDGRPTMTGVEREWVEAMLRISRDECLHRARAALTPNE